MTDRPGLDFSFSGLKTFTLNTINASELDPNKAGQDKSGCSRCFSTGGCRRHSVLNANVLTTNRLKRLVVAGGCQRQQTNRASLTEMSRKNRHKSISRDWNFVPITVP